MEIVFLLISLSTFIMIFILSKKIQILHCDVLETRNSQTKTFLSIKTIQDSLNKLDEKIVVKEKGLTTNNWENIKEAFRNKKKSDIID